MPAQTRDRILERSAELFGRRGYAGTGVKQIVAEAGAPFGSLYHFFPGGKGELGEEVIRWSGGQYARLIDEVFLPGSNPATATKRFFAGAAETLRDSDYADACPIAVIALEVASTDEPMREACAEVFESWVRGLSARFTEYGFTRSRSRSLAVTLLSALEGAFVLCRATRSTEALDTAGAAVSEIVRQAAPARRSRRAAA